MPKPLPFHAPRDSVSFAPGWSTQSKGSAMRLSSGEVLKRLGAGQTIDQVRAAAGINRGEFDAWWRVETRARVPNPAGSRRVAVRQAVRIERDRRGVPHVFA